MNYLQDHKDVLQARKGTLLKDSMNRSGWWILLGVGPYAFAPYKVIWEAYGRKAFQSDCGKRYRWTDVAGKSGYACVSSRVGDENDAHQVRTANLRTLKYQNWLRQLNGSGKRNWAQPGKIKKILDFGLRIKQLIRSHAVSTPGPVGAIS